MHNPLKQIDVKNYAQELTARGICSFVPVAIVFSGKNVYIQTKG